MNKNRGILGVIVIILVIGIGITCYTNQFVNKQVISIAQIDTEAKSKNLKIQAKGTDVGGVLSSSVQEEQIVISPLSKAAEETSPQITDVNEESPEEPDNVYESRLMEIDIQIEKLRLQETDTNTNSLKTITENELKLWDSELNSIYNTVIGRLGKDKVETLVKEEREWLVDRDARALEAAQKFGGGSLEGVEYTASLVSSTRARAYSLTEQYKQILELENES